MSSFCKCWHGRLEGANVGLTAIVAAECCVSNIYFYITNYLRRVPQRAEKVLWSSASVSVCLCVCLCVCPPSRDCRCVALLSAAKVIRCIQCCLVVYLCSATFWWIKLCLSDIYILLIIFLRCWSASKQLAMQQKCLVDYCCCRRRCRRHPGRCCCPLDAALQCLLVCSAQNNEQVVTYACVADEQRSETNRHLLKLDEAFASTVCRLSFNIHSVKLITLTLVSYW